MWYTELTCIHDLGRGDIKGPVLGLCVCVSVCVHMCACMHVCVFDQLSAQLVFMNLSENIFFQVVLDFDLLPHSQGMDPGFRCLGILLGTFGLSIKAV